MDISSWLFHYEGVVIERNTFSNLLSSSRIRKGLGVYMKNAHDVKVQFNTF